MLTINNCQEQRPESFLLPRGLNSKRCGGMKILLEPLSGEEFNDDSYQVQSCSSEPCSPDSGFSSDESTNSDSSFVERFSRCKTLPSALRRSRSKQSVKRVRFADSLGLDLENLQYFVNEPLSQQFNRLTFPRTSPSPFPLAPPPTPSSSLPRLVLSNFVYRSEFEYNEKTRAENVCVAALRASGTNIVGQVNLLNIAFDKVVSVRYTTDSWSSQQEVIANYSHRMFATEDIDAFSFTISLPARLMNGKCEFCVLYSVNGEEFWDNNSGSNYIIDVSMADTISLGSSAATSLLPRFGTMPPTSNALSFGVRRVGQFPSVPCSRSNVRKNQRRWGKSLEESDDESSYTAYTPSKKST